jgi:hypothetical protein
MRRKNRMKLTKSKLREIIREEIQKLNEGGSIYFDTDKGWKKISYKDTKDLMKKTKATDIYDDNLLKSGKPVFGYIDPYAHEMSSGKESILYFTKSKKQAEKDYEQSARDI